MSFRNNISNNGPLFEPELSSYGEDAKIFEKKLKIKTGAQHNIVYIFGVIVVVIMTLY
jgi:hypothetical protein